MYDEASFPRTRPADPLLRDVVGRVLRVERTTQGRRLVDVASAAGVSTTHLSDIERGRKEPSSEMLRAVCGALGVSLADMLDRCLRITRRNTTRSGATAIPLPAGKGPGATADPVNWDCVRVLRTPTTPATDPLPGHGGDVTLLAA